MVRRQLVEGVVIKIYVELFIKQCSDDPVNPPLGYNLHTSMMGLTYRLSWTKEVWDSILLERDSATI
jgi:hypothetical protein